MARTTKGAMKAGSALSAILGKGKLGTQSKTGARLSGTKGGARPTSKPKTAVKSIKRK